MATNGETRGNILSAPELKTVTVGGSPRQICELRIMSDEWKEDASGERVQDPVRTFPVQITVWQEALAKQCFAVLRKGMRIQASGSIAPHIYRFSDAERERNGGKQDIYEIRLAADQVSLCLNRVESITMLPTRYSQHEQASGVAQSNDIDGA